MTTGTQWLHQLSSQSRVMRRERPDAYEAACWLRNELLDAASQGVIDLSLPIEFVEIDGRLVFENVAPSGKGQGRADP